MVKATVLKTHKQRQKKNFKGGMEIMKNSLARAGITPIACVMYWRIGVAV